MANLVGALTRRARRLLSPRKPTPSRSLATLDAYSDDRGNVVVASAASFTSMRITFVGSNNRVEIADSARLGDVSVIFDCSDGVLTVGPRSRKLPKLAVDIRIGQDSAIHVAEDVSTTATAILSACEGTTIRIGRDCMIATDVQIRADDGHPIFNVKDGSRANVSRDITIGDHVWLAYGVVVLGGSTIGDGSVVGIRSVATGTIPNNVIAVGSPARVVKKDVAWERPHLSRTTPFYKNDASTITKSAYWNLTSD